MVGTPLLQEAQQKVGDPPGRRGVFAAARGEGAGDHREEGTVDEGVAINEIERGGGCRTGAGHVPKKNSEAGAGGGMKNPARRRGRGGRRMARGRLPRTTFA